MQFLIINNKIFCILTNKDIVILMVKEVIIIIIISHETITIIFQITIFYEIKIKFLKITTIISYKIGNYNFSRNLYNNNNNVNNNRQLNPGQYKNYNSG